MHDKRQKAKMKCWNAPAALLPGQGGGCKHTHISIKKKPFLILITSCVAHRPLHKDTSPISTSQVASPVYPYDLNDYLSCPLAIQQPPHLVKPFNLSQLNPYYYHQFVSGCSKSSNWNLTSSLPPPPPPPSEHSPTCICQNAPLALSHLQTCETRVVMPAMTISNGMQISRRMPFTSGSAKRNFTHISWSVIQQPWRRWRQLHARFQSSTGSWEGHVVFPAFPPPPPSLLLPPFFS